MTLDDKIEKLMENHPDLFPTKAKFWSYLRGALRRGLWEKSPMKLKFKNKNVSPPPSDYKGRGRKGDYCALTGEWTPVSKMEVDHIEGNKSLLCEEDIVPYILHLLADEDELQLVSKDAHKVKSFSERQGISFDEAKATKEAIAIQKAKEDNQWLRARNIEPGRNAKARRQQIIDVLLKEQK